MKIAVQNSLKWSCNKHVKDKQNNMGNSILLVMMYQLILLDLPAISDILPYITLAHDLMTSSNIQTTDRQ